MTRSDPASPIAAAAEWHGRWRVAQRLAQGDGVEQVAGWAGVPVATIEHLRREAAFQAQVRAEEGILALSDEAWARRLKGQMRQATERALAEGRVSTVNLLLRASLILPAVSQGGKAGRGALAAFVAEAAEGGAAPPAIAAPPAADPAPPEPVVVEADPAREARRQAILAEVKPVLRPSLAMAGLDLLEQYAAASDADPTAYEAWFAAQPKPEHAPVPLPPEDQAAIRHVTRHNPPWLRGEHLGYHREPVPREVFAADVAAESCDLAPRPPVPADPPQTLHARLERLCDRGATRLPDELDLAEAVCAVRWPNWPRYAGPTDLAALRRALTERPIDQDTLHWLGSREFAQACRGPAAREPPAR